MSLLYNPDNMSEAELKATFVGREALMKDLLDIVRHQPNGAGMQHTMILAPRGMGKTCLLRRFCYALLESDLAANWLPLKFPEELYGVTDLADFWLETLRILAVEINDKALLEQAGNLPKRFTHRTDSADAALALLKGYRLRSGKRLILLVENMDDLLGIIANGTDAGKLRDTLMNDDSLMITGSAVRFFKQARNYDQPLYNFFQIFDLKPLSFEQVRELLLKHAAQANNVTLSEQLQSNTARLQTLHYFTQGIPRLVLMLYRVLVQTDLNAVRQAVEKLLDDITPYYKARIECLPPQERKLLDHIARAAFKTNEGMSPTELAQTMYLSTNHVSTLLKRLVDSGYLSSAPLQGRKACYLLSEPLYALWHQMRLNPETRSRKLPWLVDFLRDWFDDLERVNEAKRLFAEYEKSEQEGDGSRAELIVDHILLLGQSSLSSPVAGQVLRVDAQAFWRLKNTFSQTQVTNDNELAALFADIDATLATNPNDSHCLAAKGILLTREKQDYESALQCFDAALKIDPSDADAWRGQSTAYYYMKQYDEALQSSSNAVRLNPDDAANWNAQGVYLESLGRFNEAVDFYNHALLINSNANDAKNNFIRLISTIEDYFRYAISQNDWKTARNFWQSLLIASKAKEDKKITKRSILFAAELGQLTFAKELLDKAGLQEALFPLARALDYLQAHDEALIEKLSPEVRGAVKRVIDDLQAIMAQSLKSKKLHFSASTSLSTDDDYIAERGHLVHKLKANDSTGRWAYYFILVLAPEEQKFLAALKSDETINLEDHGKVIGSCYGEVPNEKIKTLLHEKYGFVV